MPSTTANIAGIGDSLNRVAGSIAPVRSASGTAIARRTPSSPAPSWRTSLVSRSRARRACRLPLGRRDRRRPRFRDQPQELGEQVLRDRDLDDLERDIARIADDPSRRSQSSAGGRLRDRSMNRNICFRGGLLPLRTTIGRQDSPTPTGDLLCPLRVDSSRPQRANSSRSPSTRLLR
jgi:hypothetical protein